MDDLLQQGITAYKEGKRDDARKIFISVAKQDPENERVWGWMYRVSGNDKEREYCLKQILRINPKNEKAKKLLEKIDGLVSPVEKKSPQTTNLGEQAIAENKSSSSHPITSDSIKNSKKTPSNRLVAIGGGILVICFCLAVASVFILRWSTSISEVKNPSITQVGSSPIPTQTEGIARVVATATPRSTSTPLPPIATQNPNIINPGTYLVGVDIKPGIYRGGAGYDLFASCYWERLKDMSGSLDGILANENSTGQFYIEVRNSDYAVKTQCELVPLDSLPLTTEFPRTIKAGTYIIGRDIQAGTYKGQAGTDFTESCYWERLSNVAGEFDSIIANDNAVGQFYIQVAGSDFALLTACELERVGD